MIERLQVLLAKNTKAKCSFSFNNNLKMWTMLKMIVFINWTPCFNQDPKKPQNPTKNAEIENIINMLEKFA